MNDEFFQFFDVSVFYVHHVAESVNQYLFGAVGTVCVAGFYDERKR